MIDTYSEICTVVICITINPDSKPESFHKPGHLFPLVSKEKGVLVRPGHTEAAVDLAKLTGAAPAGVICEIMNDDGFNTFAFLFTTIIN
jgi:3,4-dihydroxy-2-butanone 4-phosphate synthase